jgi:transposase
LGTQEQADLLTLRQTHPEVNQTYDLVQQFVQMLRTRTGEQLDTWLARVAASQIPELQSFLLGIERDKPAGCRRLDFASQQWNRRGKSQQIKASQTHGIWQGRLPEARVNECCMRSSASRPTTSRTA